METFGSLIARGGKILDYCNTVRETDWQVHGHLGNVAVSPPEDKWIGYKTIPYPHPTFIRLPDVTNAE